MSMKYGIPEQLHPDTADLVNRFATALAQKLYAAQVKYGYSNRWAEPDWMEECQRRLIEHVAKGDPRDVAAYCAFLWHHGERTHGAAQMPPAHGVDTSGDDREPLCVGNAMDQVHSPEWRKGGKCAYCGETNPDGVAASEAPRPMQGLADWLRAQARHPCATAENRATWTAWAREVDAACGVLASSHDQPKEP